MSDPWTKVGTASSAGGRGSVLHFSPDPGFTPTNGQELRLGRPVDPDAAVLLSGDSLRELPGGRYEIVVPLGTGAYETPVFLRR